MAEEIQVVGAGLAGLIAAINLAREGFQVLVRERQARIGGRPEVRPDPAGSPFDLERLAAYTGVDIAPSVLPLKDCRYRLWDRTYCYPFPGTVGAYMVERGKRKSSLDSLLYELARREGVRFRFNDELADRAAFQSLPPRSIIATGLEAESYRALGIPYEKTYSWCAKGKVSFTEATVTIYMGPFTTDYGFSCTMNGVALAFVFQRNRPLTASDREEFQRKVAATEPFRLTGWHQVRFGACPSRSVRTPRLFWEDKILAGSVGGNMDPLLNFGMLGALVSGKIAALAVKHPREARREFRRLNVGYPPLLVAHQLIRRMPDPVRAWTTQRLVEIFNRVPAHLQKMAYLFVPGYSRMG
jgi:flavin-dependent dehydrogenase